MPAADVLTAFIVAVVGFIAIVARLFVLIAKGARGDGPSGRSSALRDDPTDTSWFTTRGEDSGGGDVGGPRLRARLTLSRSRPDRARPRAGPRAT